MNDVIENTEAGTRELTIAELDEAGGGLAPIAAYAIGLGVGAVLGYWGAKVFG